MLPTSVQLALLGAAMVVLVAGGVASLARLRTDRRALASLARVCLVVGLLIAAGVLTWRTVARGTWVPLGNNFDAMVSLAVLLCLFVLYVQRSSRMGGLDWFVMPVVVLFLLLAVLFGQHDYSPGAPPGQQVGQKIWLWAHYVTAFLGAAAFAIAAAGGAMYVITSRKLRRKAPVSPAFGSLERQEHLTMAFVVLGFALLTVSALTGLVQMVEYKQHTSHSKLILAACAWVVYAVVLHAPINPSFRGRKVAVLSIFGFALMVGTVLVVLVTGGAR